MDKKWYNFIVSVDQPQEREGEETSRPESTSAPRTASPSPAQTVAQIASAVTIEPKFTTLVNNPTSFDEIYSAAEIAPPTHGYTILKIADMLQSEHIRSLAPTVKRSLPSPSFTTDTLVSTHISLPSFVW